MRWSSRERKLGRVSNLVEVDVSTSYTKYCRDVGAEMSSEGKIWADGNAPATLIDGDKSTDFYTLGEAVIARDHLPEPRKSTATIRSSGRIFIAAEIDRLHHKPDETIDGYPVELVGVQSDNLYGGGPYAFQASSDEEAKIEADKWAGCQTFDEPVQLTLTQGYKRRGVRGRVIYPPAS
jgi:hypothetical protein